MRKLLLILFVFASLMGKAQQYSNEWIDYNKTYYKFKVAATGLYRIPQSLIAANNLSTADVTSFQLWRNGVEIPVYTSVASGALGPSDYLEFWGEMNDGTADRPLYRTPDQQISDKKSLFTDSAAYFLTINTTGNNKRLLATTNNVPTGVAAEPYFIYTTGSYYTEAIHFGRPEGSGIGTLYPASYEDGEGWASADIGNGGNRAYSENLYAYTGSGVQNIQVKMNVVGNAIPSRKIQLNLNGNLVFDSLLNGYDAAKMSKIIPVTALNGATESFVMTNTATESDRIRLASIEITYPRKFNFGGASNFRFILPAKATGYNLEVTGFNFSGTPVLYDLTNGRRYEVNTSTPSLLKVFLQPSSQAQELVLVNEAAANIKTVASFEVRNFKNYALPENQGNYLIITSNNILNGANGSTPVEDYRMYRSSAAGGGYNAKVYMIDQLIDQFSYGIKYDPLSIRNFLSFARTKYSVLPKHAFIAAKGVNYIASRNNEALPETQRLNLVPTFGYPGSDVLLSAVGSSSAPLTSIGRVSVVNSNELAIYLAKVKQYEQGFISPSPIIGESAWKKNVDHLVGASDQATIDLLYGLLNEQKKIIKDTLFGAHVEDFVRSYNTSEQQFLTDKLKTSIDNGINLLTYFGHSSATTLAFNLEEPGNYSNQGKYPVFNMMGCDVGNIFGFDANRLNGPNTISEKYVLANSRGAIGMMAGTSIGYVSTLDFYNTNLYKLISSSDYGKPMGEVMKNTIANVFAVTTEVPLLQRSQCEEYTLNGDPAIRLYQFDKPDYAIEDQYVSINPAFVSIAETKFTVNAKIYNLGKAINKEVIVELKRTYPDLSTAVIKRDTLATIKYLDSLSFAVPIDPVKDKGQNRITITIDPGNAINELNESNNSITKDLFIYEDELRPIYPYNFAIINQQGIKLSASTANPLAVSRTYMMELDTTALFNSPLKVTGTQTATGGLIEFTPGINFKDSVVYYWRVAGTPLPNEQPRWNDASFTYITGNEVGFNQSHYYQKAENDYTNMRLDAASRQFVFNTKNNSLIVKNGIWGSAVNTANQLTIEGNDSVYSRNACSFSIVFNILDKNTFKPWVNSLQPNQKGMYNSNPPCANDRLPNFEFPDNRDGRNRAFEFLKQIPDSNFVIMRTILNFGAVYEFVDQWKNDQTQYGVGNTLYDELIKQGLSQLDSFNRLRALTFVFTKNDKNKFAPQYLFSQGTTDSIILKTTATTLLDNGTTKSQVFGPAKEWKTLTWRGHSVEATATDATTLSIIGIDKNGNETTLQQDITPANINTDISGINAMQYPFLKLLMQTRDITNFTPYQLDNWRLYYTPVPEGAIAPNVFFASKDTLDPGEPLNFGVAFKNVSAYNFDSLKVKLNIQNKNNVGTLIPVANQKALIAGDTIKLNVPLATKQFLGKNTIFLEFNPDDSQPEQYHFNNFLYKDFFVKGDSINPYMDVTFDGVHILNKDIVSSKPDVLIKLTDDAKWLLLDNPDLIKVQLKFPDGQLRNYTVGNDTLSFTPANQSSTNTASINFKPHLDDGDYELIVSAKDQSGNDAGDIQYRITFSVINKPMISNMLNYPNPFTTSTAFVFTLTGSDVPQNIRIQILTITGKIVREITKQELGTLRIGRNITEFKWDGTDQFGQKLANGIYLYRVITNLNGKVLDKYKAKDDNTDKYFNKGYGKMYLMR